MNTRVLSSFVFLLCVGATFAESKATIVRFSTSVGDFDVELFEDEAPITVGNFLDYVQSGAYDDSIVHRNVGDFVIQGGGFLSDLTSVPSDPPIENESGVSNLRGTIAMARMAHPDSATSQWFINVVDNTFLDTSSGGYAVFGEVLSGGMSVVDDINQLQNIAIGGPFGSLPVIDPNLGESPDNLVVVERVTIVPEPTSLLLAAIALLILLALCQTRRLRA